MQEMVRYLALLTMVGSLAAQSGGKYQANPLPRGQTTKPGKGAPRVPASGQVQRLQTSCQARYSVQSAAIFEQGQLELVQGAGQVLTELGTVLRREMQHPVSVEGHSTSRSDGEREARYVERWLVERGFLNAHAAAVKSVELAKPGNHVEVVVDTCN